MIFNVAKRIGLPVARKLAKGNAASTSKTIIQVNKKTNPLGSSTHAEIGSAKMKENRMYKPVIIQMDANAVANAFCLYSSRL